MNGPTPSDTKKGNGTLTTDDNNTITRSNLRNCAVTSSTVKRSTFEDCVLAQVRSAHRSTGKKSHLHNVSSFRRSEVTDSTIRDKSSAHRSSIQGSNIRNASAIRTSTVTSSNISHSQLRRTKIKDCEVEECMISRCSFDGMVLKYGVWKRGQLIGKIGNREPIAIRKNDPGLTRQSDHSVGLSPSANIPALPELDSIPKGQLPVHTLDGIDSIDSAESEDSDQSEDLPPPYKV